MLTEKDLELIRTGQATCYNKRGDKVVFLDFTQRSADAPYVYIWKIIFASGYRISAICQSREDGKVFDEEGCPIDHLELFRGAIEVTNWFNIFLTPEGVMTTQSSAGHPTEEATTGYGTKVHTNPGNNLKYLGSVSFTTKL